MAPKFLDQLLLALPVLGPFYGEILSVGDGDVEPSTRVPVDDDTSRLGQDHPPSADVPRPTSALPVRVQHPLGDAAEVQGRAPQRPGAVHHGAPVLLAPAQASPRVGLGLPIPSRPVAPELDGHDTLVEATQGGEFFRGQFRTLVATRGLSSFLGVTGRNVKHKTPFALDASVQSAGEWVIHDTHAGGPVDREPQRHGNIRKPVYKVGGAVDRVDDERRFRPKFLTGLVRLFSHEGEPRVQGAQLGRDEGLDGLVGLGDQVGAVLFGVAGAGARPGIRDHASRSECDGNQMVPEEVEVDVHTCCCG